MDRQGRPAQSGVEPAGSEEELARLASELEAVTRRAEEYHDLLRRLRADFAEFRRQVEVRRAELATQSRLELLVRVLPVFDDFQQALESAPTDEAASAWADQVRKIERKLRDVIESEGVERIEAVGAYFNPWEHEALAHQASPELDDQRVLAVVRDGYRIGDRVIRPAQVVVAKRTS